VRIDHLSQEFKAHVFLVVVVVVVVVVAELAAVVESCNHDNTSSIAALVIVTCHTVVYSLLSFSVCLVG